MHLDFRASQHAWYRGVMEDDCAQKIGDNVLVPDSARDSDAMGDEAVGWSAEGEEEVPR